ncbi:MAG TPA: hypothetical protein VEZ16_00125 [Microvirga sp.]|nr:hypothetical protein [Microvirga sp.]
MPSTVKIYHKVHGETETYTISAREAVNNHPDEWSFKPWPAAAEKKPDEPPANELRVVHRGRGSYSVMRGDTELVEGLTKDEAEKKLEELKAG